jgi:magnesium-transporting ATPase (P-type)
VFDRLMIERMAVAAVTMAVVGVAAFWWMIRSGWSADSARNGLLLLMVLFVNIHIGNCRSETRSAMSVSPWRSPFLLSGAVAAFLLHVAAMYLPFLQSILRTEPVSLTTWLVMLGLGTTIFATMEVHKWTWRRRYGDA